MTDLTNPRATVAALLQDVHVLMANMQTAAEQLQHWLNATATDRAAAPAPVLVAPAAPAPASPPRGSGGAAPARTCRQADSTLWTRQRLLELERRLEQRRRVDEEKS